MGHVGQSQHQSASSTQRWPVKSKLGATNRSGQHAYVFLDGIWLKLSWGSEVKNVSILVAIGVNEDGFPSEHWRSLRTNNPLEQIMRGNRRRPRVVGAFPDVNSALLLVSALLRHIAGKTWGTKRYMDMSRLREAHHRRRERMTHVHP